MATFISDAQLLTSVSARMSSDNTNAQTMGPHVAVLVTEANLSSYDVIVGILIRRGYTLDQINNWDARTTWSLRVGACHFFRALSANKPVASYIDPNAGICKCEADLETAPIVISGIEATYGSGLPVTGTIPDSDDDTDLKRQIRDDEWSY
jgi:hypothetical protein